jgi:hypothetical protein
MKHLKSYKLFESIQTDKFDIDTLHIFDFDDTIVDSPRFEELAIKYLKEGVTIKSLVDRSLNQIGVSKEDVKIEHGRLYVNDPDSKIEVKGNWVRKKERVYLVAPDKFYYSDISFPDKVTKLSTLYKRVKNKAIVTARLHTVRSLVKKYLDKLELGQPNCGLFMYPSRDEDGSKVAAWKAKTIVKLLKDTGFKKAEYFDDKSKIVNAVVKLVKSELPDVEFIGHKVKSPEMTYLNEELLIEWDDRESFVNEIKDIFNDEIVDLWDIEQLPEGEEYGEGEELPGIFYDFNEYPLALDLDKPYLEVCLWSGNYYYDTFSLMQSSLTKFVNRVRGLGYECNQVMSMKEYLDYTEDEINPEAFEIKVYYN